MKIKFHLDGHKPKSKAEPYCNCVDCRLYRAMQGKGMPEPQALSQINQVKENAVGDPGQRRFSFSWGGHVYAMDEI